MTVAQGGGANGAVEKAVVLMARWGSVLLMCVWLKAAGLMGRCSPVLLWL